MAVESVLAGSSTVYIVAFALLVSVSVLLHGCGDIASATFMGASDDCLATGTIVPAEGDKHCLELNAGLAKLCWGLSDDYVDFHLTVYSWNDQGWFAWGLSESGSMKGADYVVYRPGPSSYDTIQVEDRFSASSSLPVLDASQDVALLKAEFENGTMYSVVRRPVASCDDEDVSFNLFANNFIWAYGILTNGEMLVHEPMARGDFTGVRVDRLNDEHPRLEQGTLPYEFLMPDVEIQKTNTKNHYVCKEYTVPTELFDKKGHIVLAEAVINADSAPFVHHINLYGCGHQGPGYQNGVNLDCLRMPPHCSELLLIWNVGNPSQFFSKSAQPALGFPIGKGHHTHFAMQMHYYNPAGETGVKDSSGFRIGYEVANGATSRVDIGILQTGNNVGWQIPAGQNRAQVTGVCNGDFVKHDITVLRGANYHLHKRGVAAETKLFGPGHDTTGTPFTKRRYFDYNFQLESPFEGAAIGEETRTIKAGTTIVTTCEFDTSSDTAPVKWGDYTQQEMCFAYIWYYPRDANIGYCGTIHEGGRAHDIAGVDIRKGWGNRKLGGKFNPVTRSSQCTKSCSV